MCVCVCPPRPRPVEAPLDLPSTTFVRDLQKCWQNPWSGPSREMWPGDMNSGRRSASEARRVLVALERRRTARSEQRRCLQPGGKLRLRPVTQLSATSGPRTQAGLAGRLLFRRAVRGTGLLTFKDCQVMLVGSTVHCAAASLCNSSLKKPALPLHSTGARAPPGSKNCRRIWGAGGSVRKVQDFPAAGPGPSHFLPDTEMSALREH